MPYISKTQEELLAEDMQRWIYESHCWEWDTPTFNILFTCTWCGEKVYRDNISSLKICRNNPTIKQLK